MTQELIDLCIKHKDIFDKYLKERGGFKVGDWFFCGDKQPKVFNWTQTDTTLNAPFVSYPKDKCIWIPSTDDLWGIAEKILEPKYEWIRQGKKGWNLWRFTFSEFRSWWDNESDWWEKGSINYNCNSLHEALLNWIVFELDKK